MPSRKLTPYRKKRDFTKTAEPSGKARVAPSRQARFVIQKHAATRLHYDFRLEFDGTFKSWAVTRGPSLDPGQKRLAVEVEDHPLDYGDFEGTIPKGQYGGGTVQIWDRGFWYSDDPDKGFKKGDLKFALMGEKLQGEWVLVRMKSDRFGGKRTNWLLIKHRDEYSKDGDDEGVLANDRSVASGRSLDEIAAGKGKAPKPFMMSKQTAGAAAVWQSNKGLAADERAEATTSASKPRPARAKRATNKPAAGKKAAKTKKKSRSPRVEMPDFVAPQLCQTAARPPAEGWVHEIKFDGYRIQMRIEDGAVSLKTRKALDWTEKFGAIAAAAAKFPDAIIDGEIVALNEKGDPDFSAMQAALSDGDTDELVYFAFDLLFADGEDLRSLPLIERKARLQALLGTSATSKQSPVRYVEHFDVAGDDMLDSASQHGLEGIISKQPDGAYHSGRSGNWLKIKSRPGHEVVIGGWKTTNGKFRSLMVGVNKNGHLAYTGIVGTGYGAETVKRLMPALKANAAAKNPFGGSGAPKGGRDVHWLKPELVAEIEFAGWTHDGLVRQAAFKGLRTDKPAREVRAEIVRTDPPDLADGGNGRVPARAAAPASAGGSSRAAARRSTARVSGSAPAAVLGVVISHPTKALWSDGGDGEPVTKRDLADYYAAIGEWMLPHIKGRPCSIVRAPDGIDGERFFQRHAMQGMSEYLSAVKFTGDRKPYLQINRIEGLVAVAQTAGVELHPWNCAPDKITVPGRLVFDLDPAPDVAFNEVIDAAKDMRDRLKTIGLTGFCKTTGGKGLHVVTPLKSGARDAVSWKEAKAFAQAVCLQMAADHPQDYLLNMSKQKRKGKIFLDYLRNDTMSTAVAPLSPRARPGAPVSMPIDWPQVKASLDPKRYTLRSAPALLKRSNPWQDYDEAAVSLKAVLKKFRA